MDAADSKWHLSSPTPYDPPLTYGGWTQSMTLGIRIAALLHAREHSLEIEDSQAGPPNLGSSHKFPKRKRKKHRVIVHSSPYLRCLQTSIAICAGLAQYSELTKGHGHGHAKSPTSSFTPRLSPRLHAVDSSTYVTPDHDADSASSTPTTTPGKADKPLLRIDAFLGEWLSPDYFEAITYPPTSTMMVASAKAELLRSIEQIPVAYSPLNSKGHFPGGWSKGSGSVLPGSKDDSPLHSLSNINTTLPQIRRERASSHSSVASTGSTRSAHRGNPFSPTNVDYIGYIPPIPSYAVSPLDPIPIGYVNHAKEACVDVDFAWDSMRDPQDWGAGGEMGEEWSSMHKRFRKGLDGMIHWYKMHGVSLLTDDGHEGSEMREEEPDEEADLVVILVTHGAGCNALIGGLTNHPALLDVGMASLTVAVHKEHQRPHSPTAVDSVTSSPPPPLLRRTSVDLGFSEEYDMRLVASVDHLRPGYGPPTPSTNVVPPIPEYHKRSPGGQSSPRKPVEPVPTRSAALGSIRRTSLSGTSRAYAGDLTGVDSTKSTGLWGGNAKQVVGTESDSSNALSESEEDFVSPLPNQAQRTVNQFGLWGGANVSGSRNERVIAPKRRWTVTERET